MNESVLVQFGDATHTFGLNEETTFEHLRRSVAAHWFLDDSCVTLHDSDNCSWPSAEVVLAWTEQLPDDIIYVTSSKLPEPSGKGLPLPSASSINSDIQIPLPAPHHLDEKESPPQPAVTPAVPGSHAASQPSSSYSGLARYQQMKSVESTGSVTSHTIAPSGVDDTDLDSEAEAAMGDVAAQSPKSMDVQAELWRIFTQYCVQGSGGPDQLVQHQWVRLLRQCGIVGPRTNQVPVAEANITFIAEVKGKGSRINKMDFEDFMGALMKIAIKLVHRRSRRYSSPTKLNSSKAFFRLLFEFVLPKAARWVPDDMPEYLQTDEVEGVFEIFRDFLVEVFKLYTKSKGWMTWAAFSKFIKDMDIPTIGLSSTEVAGIFLAAKTEPQSRNWFHQKHRAHLNLPEFVEALGRCALVGYAKSSTATPENMVKALFMHMHQCTTFTRTDMRTLRDPRSSAAVLLQSAFIGMWDADNRVNYLNEDITSAPTLEAHSDRFKAEVVVRGLKSHIEEALQLHDKVQGHAYGHAVWSGSPEVR